jgi:undecaprenyl-diphosphatase
MLASLSTWAFFAIADEVPENGWMIRVDMAVTAWLQAHGTERGESIFVIVSFLGAQVLATLLVGVAIALAVRRDWRRIFALAVTCGGGALLNVALKASFHRTRPTFAEEFAATSWSFPSGHAMDSLIGYGLLAYWLGASFPHRRGRILFAAGTLVVLIGYARIYLGVHYLSDVVAGYAAGLIWLTVCISGYRFAERRRVGSTDRDRPS